MPVTLEAFQAARTIENKLNRQLAKLQAPTPQEHVIYQKGLFRPSNDVTVLEPRTREALTKIREVILPLFAIIGWHNLANREIDYDNANKYLDSQSRYYDVVDLCIALRSLAHDILEDRTDHAWEESGEPKDESGKPLLSKEDRVAFVTNIHAGNTAFVFDTVARADDYLSKFESQSEVEVPEQA